MSVSALVLGTGGLGVSAATAADSSGTTGTTTAYADGAFHLDVPSVVRESDIVLGQPNTKNTEAIPLGNGSVGAAVWAQKGYTAQLNRDDTFPDRKSPGQIQVPGLAAMTQADDYHASLDLYTGTYTQQGGGITATTYVRADKDELVLDVTGADPGSSQTVTAGLWDGRTPTAAVSSDKKTASLAETWKDTATGGDGSTWGTLLGVTANGKDVTASVVDSKTVRVSFKANAKGSYKVVVATPSWKGGDGAATAATLLASDATASSHKLVAAHERWWAAYWKKAKLLQMSSADGEAQYMENLRTLFLYQQASLMRGQYPGSQAGAAPLFSAFEDQHTWVPADYWFWNIRMQLAANISSGTADLNSSIFKLYTDNLASNEAWTRSHVPGTQGVCVSETMRYNGGGDYGDWTANRSCDTTIAASYNSQTFSTGAEVALWMWRQYQQTGDLTQLEQGYPLMKSVAQFLLSIGTVGSDGKLHYTGNEHENQWAVKDPSMLVAAMTATYPVIAKVATLLDQDPDLVTRLDDATAQLPGLPRTDSATHTQVVENSSKDSDSGWVLAYSAQPNASLHNVENTQLEATWPFGLIGDQAGSLHDIGVRSFESRSFKTSNDWDYDAVYAARLGLADQIPTVLKDDIEKFQVYPNGLSTEAGVDFYNEQTGIVALATNEALVQDYTGTIAVAPAWPSDWDVSGSVATLNKSTVDVQYSGGKLTTVLLEAGKKSTQPVRNPWPGTSVEVRDVTAGTVSVASTKADVLTLETKAKHSYLIQQVDSPTTSLDYAPVTGTAATAAKHLGPVQIGLDAPAAPAQLSSLFDNSGITKDADTDAGNIDGGTASLSYEALAAAGASPGKTVSADGFDYTWPASAVGGGSKDNVVANGQRVAVGASGSALGFLVTATYGPASGTGTVHYADGTSQDFTLGSPDWLNGSGTVALKPSYANRQGNTQYDSPAYVNSVSVPLTAGKKVDYVTLPTVSAAPAANTPTLHVFAMAVKGASTDTGPAISAVSVADGDTVSGKTTFTVDLAGDAKDVSYTYIELNKGSGHVWVTDNTKATGSHNNGLHPSLVVDTTTLANGAYGLKIDAVGKNGKTTEKQVAFTISNGS
ncbi:hypothetical protein GCM10023221_35340 [Luteimicrobium xylanilyticum]